jgi:protein-arginine deiminase
MVVIPDPALARLLLQQQSNAGNGGVPVFEGCSWLGEPGEISAQTTIDGLLADVDILTASAEAALHIDEQLTALVAETELSDTEILRLPVLFETMYSYSIAHTPNLINSVVLSSTDVAIAAPHGPVIDGEDLFVTYTNEALAARGITTHWVEDWDTYHRMEGEVHCGSHTLRSPPDSFTWWELMP